jgi:hypothetical protein
MLACGRIACAQAELTWIPFFRLSRECARSFAIKDMGDLRIVMNVD